MSTTSGSAPRNAQPKYKTIKQLVADQHAPNRSFLYKHVLPHVRSLKLGRVRMVEVAGVERLYRQLWLGGG